MDVDAYLRRIGYSGPRGRNPGVLREVHRRHMLSVPFENLDIGRRGIVLDEAAFVRKIVGEHRGGFCYELNGAFAALLRELGFDVVLLSAGVAKEDGSGEFGPEFDHLTLRVDDNWIADVGFGDSFVEPLRFVPDLEQRDPAGVFRVRDLQVPGYRGFLLERRHDGAWTPQYRFSTTAHQLAEYAPRCLHHQTSPESTFTRKEVCSLATDLGRITLSGRRLIVTENGTRVERALAEPEWRACLAERFGVILP